MRNDKNNKSSDILRLVKELPFFSFIDLKLAKKSNKYLKITLSRYAKNGKLIRLKKGYYVSAEYLDRVRQNNDMENYVELLANVLYNSSYLSLEYILCRHGILSESIHNFTSISNLKTKIFSNEFGNFIYHKIKPELFIGFEVSKENGYSIFKATKAKALFDFLYLRKYLLTDKKSIEELRLNLENFIGKDKNEFKKYVVLEKSKRMKNIYGFLF
jgi:predicted transcriptional regulator of viral defense system